MVEFSKAYKEAVASVPNAEIIYITLEIRHPSFIDEQGNNISVFLVCDNDDLKATLESEHPLNPSQEVTFKAFAFESSWPELSPGVIPQTQVKVDNVSTEISQYLEQAVDSEDPVELIARRYLKSNLSYPASTPIALGVVDSNVNLLSAIFTAQMSNFSHKSFPNVEYTSKDFPNLVQ